MQLSKQFMSFKWTIFSVQGQNELAQDLTRWWEKALLDSVVSEETQGNRFSNIYIN